jgi:CRISPR-associated protein (TIGR03986 family)
MIPKHKNPSRPDRTAHAPYNFVPLPEKIVLAEQPPSQDQYHADRRTGYIKCTLTTESCLYTRTALNPDFFRKWTENSRAVMSNDKEREEYAQFFHLDDAQRPIIPGSSLRGMVRSLIEIVGYGKVQWVTNEALVFRAVGDTTGLGEYYRQRLLKDDGNKRYTPLMKAGYLEQQGGHWFIRPAKTIAGATFARIYKDKIPSNLYKWHGCKNAWWIWVKVGQYDYQKVRGGFIHLRYMPVLEAAGSAANGFQEAVLVYSGTMSSKRREAVIFSPESQAPLIQIDDELIGSYREQRSQEQKKLLGEQGVLNPYQPIFYLVENSTLVFFGHAMMFRLPYQHSPADFTSKSLCSDGIDLGEAIFGYVPEEKRKAGHAGRVFFTDARFESALDGVWFTETPITPAILGSPKPTTFQHYLTQQKPDDKRQLDHYGSPPPHETVIRGHKLYWHKAQVEQRDVQEKNSVDWANDTQHTQIKPVKAGVSFRFRIHFENLSDVELGALLWVLTLPGETGKQRRHKLGMGKPLGMGAVRITPTLYLSDRRARYSQLFESDTWRQAERTEPDIHPLVQAFEEYVLAGMDATERGGAKSLKEVERIKMLLKMLEWPGPDRGLTEYMKIGEPVNEYKERPVLPDPLKMEQAPHPVTSTSSNPRQGQHRRQRGPRR